MTNQSEEILDYIKANPGVSTEGIVSGTGWNRHLVEVAIKLMVEQGLVKEVGQTDWLDFRYEAIDRGNPVSPPLTRAASVMSGVVTSFTNSFPSFSQLVADSREYERSLIEIAAIANITPTELVEFYQTHPYSLETIKAAIQAGAKLDEEDIKRTMESRVGYTADGWPGKNDPALTSVTVLGEQDHTFIVTLPNNDRREVKAAYMEVDGGILYFEDDNRETILAYGPGHWVWAERAKEEQELESTRAYREGYRAGRSRGGEANPYQPPYDMGTPGANAWITGYQEAMEDREG